MKKSYLLLVLLLFVSTLFAQEKTEEPKFGIQFSGFVKSDFFHDSRQVETIREGHFLLYPAPENLDEDGEDINAHHGLNFLSIQSRLSGNITGPDAFGAKTSGLLEGAFFGHSDGDINGFRLRHAFVKLDWGKIDLLFGQTWHPMFFTDCFPGVVSFNTGVPFVPFSRNPQIRMNIKVDNLKFSVAALTQRDFTSPGGSTSLRNSALPDMHAQFIFNSDDKNIILGVGGSFKKLVPRLESSAIKTVTGTDGVDYEKTVKYKTDAAIKSFALSGFFKMKTEPVTFKLQGTFGENTFDMTMIGGYAISKITNTEKGFFEYTNLKTLSTWAEIHTNGQKIQYGLFAGYTKNLGADDNILVASDVISFADYNISGAYFARGNKIESVYRVSPRIVFNSGNASLAFETEYTAANYGTPDSKGVVENTNLVSNIRFNLGVFYYFK